MSIFSRSVTPEAFGKELTNLFKEVFQDSMKIFKDIGLKYQIQWDESLKYELILLIYFIFDLGIGSTKNTKLSNQIRDAFTNEVPFPLEIKNIIAERCMEYTTALEIANGSEKNLLQFGNVFAKHTGQADDMAIVAHVSALFQNYLKLIISVINQQKFK